MNTGFQYPAEYALPAAKKIRLENGTDLLQQNPELAYPNTDDQYTTNQTALPNNMTQEEYIKAWNDYYASIGQTNMVSNTNVTSTETTTTETPTTTSVPKTTTASGLSKDWIEVLDDETGATYYYNPLTGESSWGVAPENEEESNGDNNDDDENEGNDSDGDKNDNNKNDSETTKKRKETS